MTHAILLDLPDLLQGQDHPHDPDLFGRQLHSIGPTAASLWGARDAQWHALAHADCLAPDVRQALEAQGYQVTDLGQAPRTLASGHAARLDEHLLAGFIKTLMKAGVDTLLIVSMNKDLESLAHDFEGDLTSIFFAQWDSVLSRRHRGVGVTRVCLQDAAVTVPVIPTPVQPRPAAQSASEPSQASVTIAAASPVEPPVPPIMVTGSDLPVGAWMESLPFPMATILRRYLAEQDPHLQNEHLFHFFEGTAQFLATLMLSAFRTDAAAFQQVRALLGSSSPSASTLRSPSFGLWVTYGVRLAGETRRKLYQDTKGCLRLYRMGDRRFLDRLASIELWELLRRTLKLRNDWKGHGSVTSQPEKQRRLETLQGELDKLRALLGDGFAGLSLVRPIRGTTVSGRHEYVVAQLMGSHTVCFSATIRTSTLMESDRLYWMDQQMDSAMALLPLVRIAYNAESSEHACFFFSRVANVDGAWQARWVSYHHMERPEEHLHVLSGDVLLQIIEDMAGPSRSPSQRY